MVPGDKLRVTSVGFAQGQPTKFYDKNTVAYWRFDEADRTTVKDSSGNGNGGTFTIGAEGWRDGTLVNGPAAINGKYGNALDFAAGVDDYVEFVIFYKETGNLGNANTIGYNLHVGGGTLYIRVRNSGTDQQAVCGGCISTGRWYHVAGVSSGANSKVYIDGVDRTTSYQSSR